jgi:hypothetical protein
MSDQKYIISSVKTGSSRSLSKRGINWWIYTTTPRKKKHSGPFYSKWEAQQQLDQILNR